MNCTVVVVIARPGEGAFWRGCVDRLQRPRLLRYVVDSEYFSESMARLEHAMCDEYGQFDLLQIGDRLWH